MKRPIVTLHGILFILAGLSILPLAYFSLSVHFLRNNGLEQYRFKIMRLETMVEKAKITQRPLQFYKTLYAGQYPAYQNLLTISSNQAQTLPRYALLRDVSLGCSIVLFFLAFRARSASKPKIPSSIQCAGCGKMVAVPN